MLAFCKRLFSLGLSLKKLLHKRHYEKFADGTITDVEDEFTFEVPEGWSIIHLQYIGSFQGGQTPKSNETTGEGTIPYFKVSDMNVSGNELYMNKVSLYLRDSAKYKVFPPDSIIYPKNGGAVFTNKKRILTVNSLIDLNTGAYIPSNLVDNKYAYYLFSTIDFNKYYKGTSVPTVDHDSICELFFGLPPLVEQKEIVKKLFSVFKNIDILEEDKVNLQETVSKTKSKILDLAIHGKLVPQDTNDEPASVLLEKLRTEKEEKIAKGELKRDKKDSFIYKGSDNCYYQRFADGHEVDISEEIAFEIPDNWIWCRLRDLGDYKKGPFGSALKKSLFVQKSNNTIKVYEQKNAIQKNHKLGSYYITKDYFTSQMQGFEVLPGDIIVSCAGTIGETYVMPEKIENGIINQALMRMRITKFLNINYFLMYFDHILKEESAKSGKGTAIKNIPPFDVFKNFLIPIPPYEEQIRIVSKITELSIKLDSITNDIE